jgi:hypothetical protein
VLQAGRSPVRVLDEVECFNWPNLPAAIWPWVDSATDKNEYQEFSWGLKSGRRVGMTTLPPSVSRISENAEASTSRNPKGHHCLYRDKFTFTSQESSVTRSLNFCRPRYHRGACYVTLRSDVFSWRLLGTRNYHEQGTASVIDSLSSTSTDLWVKKDLKSIHINVTVYLQHLFYISLFIYTTCFGFN